MSAPDGGRGWLIVASGFVALLVGYGPVQAVGVLYLEWLNEFQEGKSATAWVGGVAIGVGQIIGPLCSVCVVNYGARPVAIFSGVMLAGGLMLSAFAPNVSFLIFSYGIMVGVGVGLLYAATIFFTCLYFDRKRGLALGILTTGTSVGGFVYGVLQTQLVEMFGLDACLLIVGALALNIVPCAGLMRPLTSPEPYVRHRAAKSQQEEPEAPEPMRRLSVKEPVAAIEAKELRARRRSLFTCSGTACFSSRFSLFQDRVLMALCVSLFSFTLGSFPCQFFLEDVAQRWGLTEAPPPSPPLVSLMAVMAGVGKLSLGFLADLPGVDGVFLYASTVGASGLGVLLIPLSESYVGLQVLSAVLGFLAGNWALIPYVTSQLVAVDKLADAQGILMFSGGLGLMLGPPVVGFVFDLTQSYTFAFCLTGSCVSVGSLVLFVAAVLSRLERRAEPEAPPPELMGRTVPSVPDAASSDA